MGYVSDIAERAKKSHRKEGKGESSASAAERESAVYRVVCTRILRLNLGYSVRVLCTAVCEVPGYSTVVLQ